MNFLKMLIELLFGSQPKPSYFTRAEYLKGRESAYPITPEMEANMDDLLDKVSLVRAEYGKPIAISSGYRPGHYNNKAGGAVRSHHLTCNAVDLADPTLELANWLEGREELLERCGLYAEDYSYTKGWVHLQRIAPKSGRRVFIP